MFISKKYVHTEKLSCNNNKIFHIDLRITIYTRINSNIIGKSCHIQLTILFILILNILKLYESGYNNNTLRACASAPDAW